MTAAHPARQRAPVEILSTLTGQPADPLLALINMHASDPRPDKIDVGVGIYRDENGSTPIMRAVQRAEARLLVEQDTKAYLGAEGDKGFTDSLGSLLFGEPMARSRRLTAVQTPGGTGALRLGAELIARARPHASIWVGTPTWPNHIPIFQEAGLRTESHRYFDASTSTLDFEGMLESLEGARAGDVLLVHGCCHNPTGDGFTIEQWRELATFLERKGLVPFVDLAYHGLGDGLDADVAGLHYLLSRLPEALVAYSCSKNFGLYRDRVGALWVMASHAFAVAPIRDNMLALTRSLWSMPPDHGAAVVRTILDTPDLRQEWEFELAHMRNRINALRQSLASASPGLSMIARQRGLFAMLPIDRGSVNFLRERYGIYMADSGRINLAGLRCGTLPAFVDAIMPVMNCRGAQQGDQPCR